MRRLLMLIAATAVLAACGSAAADDPQVASLSTDPAGNATTDSTDDATETTAITDPNDAALEFAKCMREHGIDMPDPVVNDEGGVLVRIGGESDGEAGSGPDPKELDAANEDCQHFMEDVVGSFEPPSEADQKRMQEEALAFSNCMRDHGIDMPDPQFNVDGGGFSVSIGSPGEAASDGPLIDFSSDEFEEASEACGGGGGFAVTSKPVDG